VAAQRGQAGKGSLAKIARHPVQKCSSSGMRDRPQAPQTAGKISCRAPWANCCPARPAAISGFMKTEIEGVNEKTTEPRTKEPRTIVSGAAQLALLSCAALASFTPPGGAPVGRRLVPGVPLVILRVAPASPAPRNKNVPGRNDPARPHGWRCR